MVDTKLSCLEFVFVRRTLGARSSTVNTCRKLYNPPVCLYEPNGRSDGDERSKNREINKTILETNQKLRGVISRLLKQGTASFTRSDKK
jgi:hypothetical protein